MATEHDLAIADEHVAHGERVVALQRAIIAKLAARGRDTTEATDLLDAFERSLQTARRHRKRIVTPKCGPPVGNPPAILPSHPA
jgi:hypothetical protein